MGITGEHAPTGIKEIVTKDGMNLVRGGPVNTQAIENAQVPHISIGESGKGEAVIQQGLGNAERRKGGMLPRPEGLVVLGRYVPIGPGTPLRR